jgi:hypothetical protein
MSEKALQAFKARHSWEVEVCRLIRQIEDWKMPSNSGTTV